MGACGGLVDLVDDDDDGEGEREGLLEDEVGLGHGALLGVDEEEGTVGHLEDSLDLSAEVGVSGGVNDVDGVVLVAEGAVLGGDGDAALALEVVGVHEALLDLLVVAEAAGELEESVDDGGLAVVDVRDDGDVADFVLLHVLRWGEGEGNRSAKEGSHSDIMYMIVRFCSMVCGAKKVPCPIFCVSRTRRRVCGGGGGRFRV